MNTLEATALLTEDEPFAQGCVMAGYNRVEDGWMKRFGGQIIVIRKFKDSSQWEHCFHFKGKDDKPLTWATQALKEYDNPACVVQEILTSEICNYRSCGHEILGMKYVDPDERK